LAYGGPGSQFHQGNIGFWLIFAIPIAIIVLFPINSRQWIQRASPYISVGAMAIGAIIATFLWFKAVKYGLPANATDPNLWKVPFNYTWFWFGDWKVNIGISLDGFSIFTVWMVTVVTMCIQWFSIGYMWDDEYGRKHYARYFAEHSLFAVGMLAVVLSNNILSFMVGWEVMGLCSYLLIGFFTYKPSANAAQVKAFITTRIGDVGFMLGIFMVGLMYTYTGRPIDFGFDNIRWVVTYYDWWAVNLGWLPTAAALLIFMGAVGKSAQFPLHVWLPDAMEGPTPVSALIHAATMVAAGVFLVARFFWLFELSETALMTVAWIGAITAFGAATIGVVQYDIKRILAYSTISQLGYMMIGIGVGSASAGVFHLLTHAYFKALLFLGAGAVIYGCRHIQDIRYMGGLSKKMPITYATFLVGTLALAGIFPFAGFWSKDEILASAFDLAQHGYARVTQFGNVRIVEANPGLYIIWLLGVMAAFLTAFYMFRLLSYVFLGGPKKDYEYRGPQSPDYRHHAQGEKDTATYSAWDVRPGPFDAEEHHNGPISPKEVPKSMWIPLVILAVLATVYGFIGTPLAEGKWNIIAKFLNYGHIHKLMLNEYLEYGLMVFSLAVALLGVHYGLKVNNTEAGVRWKETIKAMYPGLYKAVYNKYYVDEFYEENIIQPVFMLCQVARAFDTYIVDGIVNAVGWLTYQFARLQGWFDNAVVDGIVNGVVWVVNYFSNFVKPIQSGFVQNYMMVVVVFVLFYLLSLFIR
ncbi:MAG: NADH-quinone oxidoreductase subunit L, partial [bacterium]|nr:NADH-quinone oxidoreductase subunit L [bacterium]